MILILPMIVWHVSYNEGKKMKGFWCYNKAHWSADYCNDVLRRVGSNDFVLAGVGTNGILNNNIRKGQIKFIQNGDPAFRDVFDKIWLDALEANHKFFNFHITKLDYIQISKYTADNYSEYKSHQDVFWLNGDPEFHRKLSCSIQLSNPLDYDGSDLELENVDEEYPPVNDIRMQGTSIYFPSFIYHKVTPITRGTRYSLVAWFDGPKWR